MNSNDDSSSHWEGDPLADRLAREAMAEQPAFSPELHRQIMERVRAENPAKPMRLGPRLAVAASILVTISVTASWIVRSHQSVTPHLQGEIATNIQQPSSTPMAISTSPIFKVDIGDGIIVGRVWPPGITVRLPSMDEGDSPSPQLPQQSVPSPIPAVSPQWMLSFLQEPTDDAKAALIDLIPPEARLLASIRLSKTQ